MPDGIRRRIVFLPAMTSVCPALCPPWKRTTPSTSSVSQSTILPLPSSPHCVPTTTTFCAIDGSYFAGDAVRATTLQLPFCSQDLAVEHEIACLLRPRRAAPAPPPRPPRAVAAPALRSPGSCPGGARIARGHAASAKPRKVAQVDRKADRRPCAAECLADVVVAPAAQHRRRQALDVHGERHAVVIAVPVQVREIERDVRAAVLRDCREFVERRADRRQATAAANARARSHRMPPFSRTSSSSAPRGLLRHAGRPAPAAKVRPSNSTRPAGRRPRPAPAERGRAARARRRYGRGPGGRSTSPASRSDATASSITSASASGPASP